MDDYSQPDFYHFDEDSINLVKFMSSFFEVEEDLEEVQGDVLEIGAGCGVISIELHKIYPIKNLTLVEQEPSFESYISKNLPKGLKPKIFHKNFLEMNFLSRFDLIYFNPPFFFVEDSRASASSKRDSCRRIKRADWEKWLFDAIEILNDEGRLFFCHRNVMDFGNFEVVVISKKKINQTWFYYLKKTT